MNHVYDPYGQLDPEPENNQAADLIRDKLSRLYAGEPSAVQEAIEAEAVPHRSPHQEFMHQLSASGKDLATVQTEWHNYYLSLDNEQKRQVWQEFYSSSATLSQPQPQAPPQNLAAPIQQQAIQAHAIAEHKNAVVGTTARHKAQRAAKAKRPKRDLRSPQAIRAAVRDTVTANGKLTAKQHLQSLLFGLSMGAIVIVIIMFSFFNQLIITPFIQPNRSASTPIIVNAGQTASVSSEPKVIIPKINVEAPVDFSLTTTEEETIQSSLNNGVVHYASTVKPGEQGNTAIFGHSSNNLFNKGNYKFIFLQLHKLQNGDTFYISHGGKNYVYKVIDKKVVDPTALSILDPVPGKNATATLITCDPPGTTLKRLAIIGEQISPDPSGNVAAAPTAVPPANLASALPGDGPTLFARIMSTFIGKAIAATIIVVAIIFAFRTFRRPRQI